MGYLRLALALSVMVAHVGPRPRPFEALLWWHGSVWLFFAISGYLMTLCMDGPYKGRPMVFLANRALRLMPTYWMVLALTLAGFAVWGAQVEMQSLMLWPTLGELLSNALLIIPIEQSRAVPMPVAWSLSVECFYYILIAMGLFSCPTRSAIILGGAIAGDLVVHPAYNDLRWALIPFAVGAVAYWMGLRLPRDGYWAAWCGALSYPFYLVHSSVGAFIWDNTDLGWGWPLFFAALGPTLALSWLLVVAVERPVQHYRQRLRQQF